jgi:hypothetical protein
MIPENRIKQYYHKKESYFTSEALRIWKEVPCQQKILANVWCSKCSGSTTIINYSGFLEQGLLILKGKCIKCNHQVCRVLENE